MKTFCKPERPACNISALELSASVIGVGAKERRGNNTLSRLSNCFCAIKLNRSVYKTSYSVFGKHVKDKHNTTMRLCNNDIQEVSCCKYLGVYVDNTSGVSRRQCHRSA